VIDRQNQEYAATVWVPITALVRAGTPEESTEFLRTHLFVEIPKMLPHIPETSVISRFDVDPDPDAPRDDIAWLERP